MDTELHGQARIKRLVYGAADPKTGAAGSVIDICRNPQFNHQIIVESGLLAGNHHQTMLIPFNNTASRKR